MRKGIGFLAFASLIASIGLVAYLLINPLYVLIYTPYVVLTSASTLSFSALYFFLLNDVKHWFLSTFIYALSILPLIVPLAALFQAEIMEEYWKHYLSLTMLQLGVGMLSATFFFRFPKRELPSFLGVINALLIFTLGGLTIVESPILGSLAFIFSIASIITALFMITVVVRLKQL